MFHLKNFILKITLILLLIIAGWILNDATKIIFQGETQVPFFTGRVVALPSPSDIVPQEKIKVYKDFILINISNAEWSILTDTHSMEPTLNKNANALEVIPSSEDQIHKGDIVAYKSRFLNSTIIHRVISTGTDEEGVYFVLKGDNTLQEDLERVRFEQIERVVIGIIY